MVSPRSVRGVAGQGAAGYPLGGGYPRPAPQQIPLRGGGGGDSLSAMRASLEQISRVVNGALIATQSAAGGRQAPPPAFPPFPSTSSLLDGPMAAHPSRRSTATAAVRSSRAVPMGWRSEYENELYDALPLPIGGGDYAEDASGLPSFLGRWRDEQDVAQELLQQHSSWLRGFREQIGRVSVGSGGGGRPSSGAVGAPSGGIPMRIPIGNNKEVVVTVQPSHL